MANTYVAKWLVRPRVMVF